MSNELRSVKWVRFFERNCVVKWVIFFASFCWLWEFLLDNLKMKQILWWYPLKCVDKYIYKYVLHARDNIFKKVILNTKFWIIYILDQISFLGTALGCFSQSFFNIFCRWPTTVADIFTHPPPVPPPPPIPHHKKASYGLVICS